MIIRLSAATLALAVACWAIPAGAEEVGVGIGPAGVTVHGDRDRDKTIIRDHGADRDKTVIINKDRDRDADRDKTVVIHHD